MLEEPAPRKNLHTNSHVEDLNKCGRFKIQRNILKRDFFDLSFLHIEWTSKYILFQKNAYHNLCM